MFIVFLHCDHAPMRPHPFRPNRNSPQHGQLNLRQDETAFSGHAAAYIPLNSLEALAQLEASLAFAGPVAAIETDAVCLYSAPLPSKSIAVYSYGILGERPAKFPPLFATAGPPAIQVDCPKAPGEPAAAHGPSIEPATAPAAPPPPTAASGLEAALVGRDTDTAPGTLRRTAATRPSDGRRAGRDRKSVV